ncbi:syntaxin-18 isoform X3 [Scleropages formosus]|uniref:syntaxin-18 isoform X3 n=1 Tax=Scleropages formosus TaxID=113540 RepID=UPI000878B01B|nr:syntaxin-18 isoform X3 [Scleropages formosus]
MRSLPLKASCSSEALVGPKTDVCGVLCTWDSRSLLSWNEMCPHSAQRESGVRKCTLTLDALPRSAHRVKYSDRRTFTHPFSLVCCSLISSDLTRMTDSERDQIDQDAQIFMRTCSDAIRQLRSEAEKQVSSSQVKEHRGAVLDLIEDYLRGVCKLYSEQRAVRVKRVVDRKRLSRLEPEHHSRAERSPSKEPSEEKEQKEESSEVPEAPESSVSLWEEGRVEDELSPEEIQMVCLHISLYRNTVCVLHHHRVHTGHHK